MGLPIPSDRTLRNFMRVSLGETASGRVRLGQLLEENIRTVVKFQRALRKRAADHIAASSAPMPAAPIPTAPIAPVAPVYDKRATSLGVREVMEGMLATIEAAAEAAEKAKVAAEAAEKANQAMGAAVAPEEAETALTQRYAAIQLQLLEDQLRPDDGLSLPVGCLVMLTSFVYPHERALNHQCGTIQHVGDHRRGYVVLLEGEGRRVRAERHQLLSLVDAATLLEPPPPSSTPPHSPPSSPAHADDEVAAPSLAAAGPTTQVPSVAGALATVQVSLGFDETDFDESVDVDERIYEITGGKDTSVIGGYDPKPLSQLLRSLASPLDSVMRGNADTAGAVQLALDELAADVPRRRGVVRAARAEYAKRILLYQQRNDRVGANQKAGKARSSAKKPKKPPKPRPEAEPEVSTIAQLKAALADKSTPISIESTTDKVAGLLNGRLVRRWWPGEEGEEPTIGVISSSEVDEADGIRYYLIEHPTVGEEYGDELKDLVDLDALLAGDTLEGEDGEDLGRLQLVPFADMTLEQLIAKEIKVPTLKAEASLLRPKPKIAGSNISSATKKQLATAIVSHYASTKQRLEQLMNVAHAAVTGEIDEGAAQALVADLERAAGEAAESDEQDAAADRADGAAEAAPAAADPTGAAPLGLAANQADENPADSPSQLKLASAELKAKQVTEIDKRQDAIDLAVQRLSLVLRLLRDAKALGYTIDIDVADEAMVSAADAETLPDAVAEAPALAPDAGEVHDKELIEAAHDDSMDVDGGHSGTVAAAHADGGGNQDSSKQWYPKVRLKIHGLSEIETSDAPEAPPATTPPVPPSITAAVATPPPPPPSLNAPVECSSIATRARKQLIDMFKERVVKADKLLIFMLSDISHTCSVCIGRFAVTASMDSTELNELVEYMLAGVRRVSEAVLEVSLEVADGARTNLVRECRASVRTSARPSMPGDRGSLPCSTREAAIDTNSAVRLWRVRREAVVFTECAAVQSEAAKRAMKQSIYRTFCGVLLPMGVRHWPNLYGWLHRMFAKRKGGGSAAEDGGALAPDITPVEADDAEADHLAGLAANIAERSVSRAIYQNLDQNLAQCADDEEMHAAIADGFDERFGSLEAERADNAALRAIQSGVAGDIELPPSRGDARPPFRNPRPAGPPASALTAEEAEARARARYDRIREQIARAGRPFNAPRSNDPFKEWLRLQPLSNTSNEDHSCPVEDVWAATENGGFRKLDSTTEYDWYDEEACAAFVASPRPPPRLHPSVQASIGFAARVRQAQARAAHRGESGSDAHWAAMRGASYSSRTLHPTERRIFERLRDMRPPNHERPLSRKMAAALKGTAAPDMDELLEVSQIRPMPTTPTSFGGEGLAMALLAASTGNGDGGADGGSAADEDGDGRAAGAPQRKAGTPTCTMAALQLERFMRLAVDQPEVTVMDMLYELRVALMDHIMWELATFHDIELRDQVVVRDGHWFIQCWVHKYKNLVQSWRALELGEGAEEEAGFSRARLVRVARKLEAEAEDATDRKMYRAVALALLGKTDALSQAAMTWVLICPQFLDALEQDPTCWLEHTVLYVCGQAYMGWDMPHLTDVERSYRIELCEAVLMYSVGGEQMYLPFLDESTKGKQKGAEPGLVGILAGRIGSFTSQNLLAFLANGAARRQFRQQYPKAWASFVERSVNNNPCENFFSLIAQLLGYKPRLVEFEARARELDYAMHEEFDPERAALYAIHQSKRKWYDMANFCLVTAITAWNDGTGLDPGSEAHREYIMGVAKRAVHAAKGKYEGVHAHHKKASTEARH